MKQRHSTSAASVALLLTASLLVAAPPQEPPVGRDPGQDQAPPAKTPIDNPIKGNEITPEQQKAVERGLAYLAGRRPTAGRVEVQFLP